MNMQETLNERIMDFYEAPLPEVKSRKIEIHELPRNVSTLVGMRRTGKTFRIYQKIQELVASGVSLDRILYLNLDDDRLRGMTLEDLGRIPDIFYQFHPENHQKSCYFFLDEIQDIENWEVFARRMIDSEQVRLFLTGSSSKLLSKEISTALRGRSVETEVFPLSFEEYLRFHDLLDTVPRQFSSITRSIVQNSLKQYFMVGGFPEVQNCSLELWASKLQGYAGEVLFRDVVERYHIANVTALRYILQKAFHNPCAKLSANAIYRELKGRGYKVDRESISEYITHFCQAYLLYSVPFHSESLAQRQVNPPKFYAVDIGLVRAMNSKRSADLGHLLENLVFLHLRRKGYEIEYLVTSENYEVDFVAYHKFDREYHLFQVCYAMDTPDTLERERRALLAAKPMFNPIEMTIVTWEEEKDLDGGIQVVPAWKFLLRQT